MFTGSTILQRQEAEHTAGMHTGIQDTQYTIQGAIPHETRAESKETEIPALTEDDGNNF
jgi:hypothetical protein